MSSTINGNCTNCALCLDVCPTQSISAGEIRFVIDTDTCTDCKKCVEVCPYDAIVSLPKK